MTTGQLGTESRENIFRSREVGKASSEGSLASIEVERWRVEGVESVGKRSSYIPGIGEL
jgi:hypothetical protein